MNKIDDIYGTALYDFFKKEYESDLIVDTSYGKAEVIPIELFLKTQKQFTSLEHFALNLCKGKILDIGAGSGSHALYLQKKRKDVTALEISPLCARLMKERGINNVLIENIFEFENGNYNTLLLLMNGIGIAGTVEKLETLLIKLKKLLVPNGQILFDSSDINYIYDQNSFPKDHYYGEVKFRYTYKGQIGKWFNWLYIDQKLMGNLAKKHNLHFQVIYEQESGQYLGRLINF